MSDDFRLFLAVVLAVPIAWAVAMIGYQLATHFRGDDDR
jgi:hypothetical protein